MKELMESEEKHNPWDVSNLEEFLYYSCPECDCKNKDKEDFVNHAVISHPRAKNLIGPEIRIEIEELDESTTLTQCHDSDILEPELGHQQFTTSHVKIDVQDEFQSDFSDPDHDLNSDIVDPLNCDTNIDETQVQQKEPNIETNQEEKSTKRSQRRKAIKSYTEVELNEPVLKKCQFCNQKFKGKHLEIHIRSIHLKSESKKRKFKCDECGNRYKNPTNLNLHIQSIHQGVRFKCEVCAKLFTREADLKRHFRGKHEGYKVYCGICDKSYGEKNSLRAHYRIKHPASPIPDNFNEMKEGKPDQFDLDSDNIVKAQIYSKMDPDDCVA